MKSGYLEDELLVVCAWCGKVKSAPPTYLISGVSHGICLKCFDEKIKEGKDKK